MRKHIGVGPAIVWGWILEATAWMLIPLAGGPAIVIIGILVASRALEGLTGTIANIHQWTLRQSQTPEYLQGRVTASHRFLFYGSGAIGALMGGVLGSLLDLRTALFACAAAALLTRLGAIATPLRTLKSQSSGAVSVFTLNRTAPIAIDHSNQ